MQRNIAFHLAACVLHSL